LDLGSWILDPKNAGDAMKYIYALFILLLALFLAAFIQQNSTEIQLRYFAWYTPFLPLSLYMILSFAAGYALAVIVGFTTGMKHRFRASGAERELRQLRAELDQLKNEELKTISKDLKEESEEPSTPQGDDDRNDNDTNEQDEKSGNQTVIIGKGGEEEEK
jgi:uncharacterized integral membrane protein